MSKYPPEKSSSNNANPGAPSDVGYAPYPHEPAPTDPQAKPKKPSFIKRIAPGQTPAQLLNPAPSCFERPPPPHLPYPPFPPMILIGKEALDKGFLVNLPEASLPWNGPHPFETHDISEEDWARFLHDVKIAASLAPKDRLKAALIPAPIGILTGGIGAVIGEPFRPLCTDWHAKRLLGFFITMRIQNHIKKTKIKPVGVLIDQWNQVCFEVHAAIATN